MDNNGFEREHCGDRTQWLERRDAVPGSIGASECAVPAGYSPWQTVDELYDVKIGRVEAPSLDDTAAIRYGRAAEDHVRELVRLDVADSYEVENFPYDILRMKGHPYIFATLDGELTRKSDGAKGVLEIKTGHLTKRSAAEWTGGIPLHYYAQVCQQLLVTGWEYAVVCYRLYDHYNGNPLPVIRMGYRYVDARTPAVRSSMEYILECDEDFHNCVVNHWRPTTTVRWAGTAAVNTRRAKSPLEEGYWE